MERKVDNKDWTRNIQQKFDVVCQEVDEFVSMATMTYVENQVQTLGETVMGFCSNVMQDFLPSGLSNPVNFDAATVPQKGKFVTETYKKSVTNLEEKYADTDAKFLPSALSNPVNHDAGTVSQEGKFVMETYKKSVTNLKEKYADTDAKLLPSALSNPVIYGAESVPQEGKDATQNYNKPLIIIEEKYADIASKRISTKQDSVHQVPPYYSLNNVKHTMPMPTEEDKNITEALFPLTRDESAVVHDNVKTSVVGYIGSEFEGLVAKEKSLSWESNFIGINDKKSLVFVTEDDYHNNEITDEAVSAAVDDSVKVCSSVKERTCDTFFDDCHCKILGTSQSSEVDCSFSCDCEVVEPMRISFTSSLSNDSYYQSEFYTIPHEAEKFIYDHTDSEQTMPIPSEGDNKITEALFFLARDEFALVHDNVKTSAVGYIGSEFEGLVAKEKSLSEESNSIEINDKTSLVLVTEDDYHNHEITDEAVSAAVNDSVRVCSSVKDRTCDTLFDDFHYKILGTPQSSKVECSFSCGCQVVKPTLISATSSLSNDSYYQSEFYTNPLETENFVYDHTDSICSVSETPGHADESKIDILDPNMRTIDLSEKTKLNESCVIVDNKLLGATSYRPRRHRSYKQMIKDAFTSTKRLTKEYELLGILYGDIDEEASQHEKHSSLASISERTPGNQNLATKDLGDSDWELV